MMSVDKAIRLAHKWAAGHVCTLREGEAQEYHQLCAEALERSRWIPVTERLPEEGVRVLVRLDGDKPPIGEPRMDTDRVVDGRWVRWFDLVTHWMPLPNKPKED